MMRMCVCFHPYEFMDAWEKLEHTQLPTQVEFYDNLNDRHISDADYALAQRVWQTFKIRTLGEYTQLYLKTDVLLLADVFENFRDNFFGLFRLDPAQYCILPGYTNDAMSKYTRARIELFTDLDDLLFIERGLRGGISQCNIVTASPTTNTWAINTM